MQGFKMNNMKLLSGVLVIISLSLFCVYLIQGNLTYANENNVYVFEDLRVGDFVPFGATIMTTEDYHGYSGARYNQSYDYTEGYVNYAGIYYFKEGESNSGCYSDCCKYEELSNHISYKIQGYNDVFNSNDNYTGWIVKSIYGFSIRLEPVEDYSKINRTPSANNAYTIDTHFVDTEDNLVKNAWYFVKDIADYEIEGDNFWVNEDNVFRFRNTGDYPAGNSYTLTYTFDASQGEIVTFDTRSWLGQWVREGFVLDSFTIRFNGKELNFPTGRRCYKYGTSMYCEQSADLYETVTLPIENTGKQTLLFTYTVNGNIVQKEDKGTYTYGYVRGVRLLTLINEGKKLDTSLVEEGDKIIYKSTDPDGQVLGEELTYSSEIIEEEKPDVTPPEEENKEDPPKEEIENPNTNVFMFSGFVIVLFVSLAVIVINKKKKDNLEN